MNLADDIRLHKDATNALMADYLTRLEEALELLGPAEAAEIRTEPPDLLENAALEAHPELFQSARDNSARAYETLWISETSYVDPESPHLSDATFLVEAIERGDQRRTPRFAVHKVTEFWDDGASGVTTYRISHIEIGEGWIP